MMQTVMITSLPMNAFAARSNATRSPRPRVGLATGCAIALQIAILAANCRAADLPPAASSHARAELLADAESIEPGMTFLLAVRLVMEDGWHVNWVNPGDAGLAPSIAWKLPAGFRAGLLHWPMPGRFVTGPLVIFGYAGEVVLATEVRVPEGLSPGHDVELTADVSWLACVEACVPGSASVTMRLPVEAKARPNVDATRSIEAARARWPAPSGAWNVQARVENSTWLVLDIQTAAETTPPLEGLFFFPYDQGVIENAAAQTTSRSVGTIGRAAYQLRVERARMPDGTLSRLSGVLVSASGWSPGDGPAAIEVDVPIAGR